MKNIGLRKLMFGDVETFVSDKGIKIRRDINPAIRGILKLAAKSAGTVIVESYPNLEKDEAYIFISTHTHSEEAVATLSALDRHAYLLMGTTDQVEHNPQVYMAHGNGFIYFNRSIAEERKMVLPKQARVLNNGSSVLYYPTGVLMNELRMVDEEPFASPRDLANMTGKKVIFVSAYQPVGTKTTYLKFRDPVDLRDGFIEYPESVDVRKLGLKEAARQTIKDTFIKMRREQIIDHSPIYSRDSLGHNPIKYFMEERLQEYLKTPWTQDVWEEELNGYVPKINPDSPEAVWSYFDNQSFDPLKVSKCALPPREFLQKRLIKSTHNFKDYMHENWNKQ